MKHNLDMSKFFSATLLITAVIISTIQTSSRVFAQFICIPDVGCRMEDRFEPTMGSFNVYIKNKSGHPIEVCVEWYQQENYALPGGGSTNWDNGCWTLKNNQTKSIIDNAKGRYIYFSANATDGSGLAWERKKVDMGSAYTRFEYTFR